MGTISVLEITARSHALRGNAAQDAPRPLCGAMQSVYGPITIP